MPARTLGSAFFYSSPHPRGQTTPAAAEPESSEEHDDPFPDPPEWALFARYLPDVALDTFIENFHDVFDR